MRLIGSEIKIAINDQMTVADLNYNIENSDGYESKLTSVTEIL